MPPNKTVDQGTAEATVFENLGMSASDLGAGDMDENENVSPELDRDAETDEVRHQPQRDTDAEDDAEDDQRGQQINDLQQRVSHTEGDQQQRRPLPRNAEVRADSKGNLVNAQGQIVARAGKEARLYKERHQAIQRMQQLEISEGAYKRNLSRAVEIGQELHSQVEKLQAQISGINQVGLQPNELLEAAALFSEAKQNPIQVLKKLLTRAAANGIDLTQLGLQGGDAMRTLAEQLRSEISQQMKPLQDRNEAERKQREEDDKRSEQYRNTETHIQQFFSQNPSALPYVEVFKAVVSNPKFSDMSLGEIWARIQLNEARGQGRPRSASDQNRQRSPRMPNGRGGAFIPSQNQPIASPDMSYNDILKGVMDEFLPSRR